MAVSDEGHVCKPEPADFRTPLQVVDMDDAHLSTT